MAFWDIVCAVVETLELVDRLSDKLHREALFYPVVFMHQISNPPRLMDEKAVKRANRLAGVARTKMPV